MDFIGDDKNIMAFANLAILAQFVFRPDPANGIVRAAKDGQFDAGVSCPDFQVGKIHFVVAIIIDQRAGDDFTAAIGDGPKERVIDRLLHQNLVTGLAPGGDGKVHGRHNAGGG